MKIEERLIRYCKIDTQSDPKNEDETPSTSKQFNLANLLKEELEAFGLENVEVDEHCYVYAKLPSNMEGSTKTVGFIAHMDTAPDFSGTNVQPRIIENFDGNDIILNENRIMKMEDFPWMKEFKGKRLMVTDGNTLLGVDDKAGIACIMEMVKYFVDHPEIKHPTIMIGFTPDEEIGNGVRFFNVDKFGADFAYTIDGETAYELSDETFNASSAVVYFKGFSIHPGEAKDRMINAGRIAAEYSQLLPEDDVPEKTEGREGFIHFHGIEGNVEKAQIEYIIRDHDFAKLKAKEALMAEAVKTINDKYGKEIAKIEFKETYRNMKEVLDKFPEALEVANNAFKALGITPLTKPIRGGTDGAMLSFKGLPCPNLGNGGGNFHGPFEYCVIDEMELEVEILKKIVEEVGRLKA